MCYIGVRTCKCTIWDDEYMGSSRHMTEEDKANCNKIVLKRFDNREDAVAYEVEMHEKFDVANNPMFYNKAKQTSTGFDTCGVKVQHSEEHKKKISPIGRIHKEETKNKIRNTHRQNVAKHKGFKPWWFEVKGVRTEVYDETPKQFSERLGINYNVVKDRFRSQYKGKPKQSEPLKGYIFGRIE